MIVVLKNLRIIHSAMKAPYVWQSKRPLPENPFNTCNRVTKMTIIIIRSIPSLQAITFLTSLNLSSNPFNREIQAVLTRR